MDSKYTVSVTLDADRDLGRAPRRIGAEIAALLDELAEDPYPLDALELRGHAGY